MHALLAGASFDAFDTYWIRTQCVYAYHPQEEEEGPTILLSRLPMEMRS